MITLDDFQELERKVRNHNSRIDKAKGALAQLLARLKKEHGCKTAEEAKKVLKQILEKRDGLGKKYQKKKAEIDRKYKDKLEEEEDNDND